MQVRSVGNSLVLKETALIEAFNLKAAIEYQMKNYEAAQVSCRARMRAGACAQHAPCMGMMMMIIIIVIIIIISRPIGIISNIIIISIIICAMIIVIMIIRIMSEFLI